jgi:hypothetical protein
MTVIPHSGDELTFVAVRPFPFTAVELSAGPPLCAAEFSSNEVVGSFEFLQRSKDPLRPRPELSDRLSVTSILLPLDPALPLTDLEVRNGTAYISANSSLSGAADLVLVNIADSGSPRMLSSINTGPGISAIALAGKHVFAAAASTASQLHTIRLDDISDVSASLSLEGRYQLPLPYATATPPYGSAIFYDHRNVYIGTEKWDGDEFTSIDVSDPTLPRKTGGLEIGSKVNDIYVSTGAAFVAGAGERQLMRVDVSDPAEPFIADTLSPSGWLRQEGRVLSLFEDSLSFGRTTGGFNIVRDHELFALSATSTDGSGVSASIDVPGGIYGIVADRRNIFTVTRQAGKELQVFNRGSPLGAIHTSSLPIVPQALACDGDQLYVLAQDTPTIYKINFNQN